MCDCLICTWYVPNFHNLDVSWAPGYYLDNKVPTDTKEKKTKKELKYEQISQENFKK